MIVLQPNAKRALAQVGVHQPRISMLMRDANRIIEGARPARTQEIYGAGKLHMIRHFISSRRHRPQVWLHQFLISDPREHSHTHPGWSLSVALKGVGADVTPSGRRSIKPGDVIVREAEHTHRIEIVEGPLWTLYVSKKPIKQWGFIVEGEFMPAPKYLATIDLANGTGGDRS